MIDLLRRQIEIRDNYENIEEESEQEVCKPKVTRIGLFIIIYASAIASVVLGAVYLHDCPYRNMLPIGMIVVGGTVLLTRLVSSPTEFRWTFRSGDGGVKSLPVICLKLVLEIISLCWLFAVCYWFYSIDPDTRSERPDLPNFCEENLLRGAYWTCLVGLAFVGALIGYFIRSICKWCFACNEQL